VAGFRAFDSSVSPETGQVLMQGTHITLVTVAGDLRAEGLSSSVTVEPVSAATRTVTVTGENGGAEPIGLRLPVSNHTTADAWADSAINDSLPGKYVDNVEAEVEANGKQFVNITLQPEQTYTLRVAKVEVREKDDSSVTDDPEEKYLIPVTGDNSSVLANQSQTLTTEVRDRFNNPVSGVNVSFRVEDDDVGGKLHGSTFGPDSPGNTNTTVTDGEGRASKVFNPSAAGTAYVNSSFTNMGGLTLNNTNMTVSVLLSAKGAGGKQSPNAVTVVPPPGHVEEGGTITLKGGGSSDPDGSIATYQWAVQSGPGWLQSPRNDKKVTYEAPDDVDGNTTVSVALNLTDNQNLNGTDKAVFYVNDTDRSGSEGGAGQGAETNYYSSDKEAVTTAGGVWYNITDARYVQLSSPRFVPFTGDDKDLKKNERYFKLAFTLVDNTSDNNDHRYYFLIGSSSGLKYKASDQSWGNAKIYIYEQKDDGSTTKLVDGAQINSTIELQDWYDEDDPFDLLNSSSYDEDISSELSQIKGELDEPGDNDNPDEIVFTLVRGRARMIID